MRKKKKRAAKKAVSKIRKIKKRTIRRTKKRPAAKKPARRKAKAPVVIVPKTTKRKRVFIMARKKAKKSGGKRRRGSYGGGKANYKTLAMEGVAVVGGVVGGAALANVIPIADGRVKAAASIGIGLVLASTNIFKGHVAKMAALGMIAGGGLALVRRMAPNMVMLAGEAEDLNGLEYDLSGVEELEYMGADDDGSIMDQQYAVSGEMEELTGSAELLGTEAWVTAE